MSDGKQDDFAQRAQEVLQASAEQLDVATRSRLTQARHAALEVIKRRHRPWLWLMPAVGAAAAAVLTLALLVNPARQQVEPASLPPDEFEIIASEDGLEFYRDVEFYAWLDTVLEEEIAPENGV